MTDGSAPTPSVSWAAPPDAAGPAPGIEFAPHGPRLLAYILDGIIIAIVVGLMSMLAILVVGASVTVDKAANTVDLSGVSSAQWLVFGILITVATIIAVLYFPFFWARGGQTLGMRPFGLWVVRDRDGGPIGWGTAILRLFGLYLASLVFYLGYIWIFIDKRRRGWQDLIAGTIVIRRP